MSRTAASNTDEALCDDVRVGVLDGGAQEGHQGRDAWRVMQCLSETKRRQQDLVIARQTSIQSLRSDRPRQPCDRRCRCFHLSFFLSRCLECMRICNANISSSCVPRLTALLPSSSALPSWLHALLYWNTPKCERCKHAKSAIYDSGLPQIQASSYLVPGSVNCLMTFHLPSCIASANLSTLPEASVKVKGKR